MNVSRASLKRTSSFETGSVECIANVIIRRKAVEIGRVRDCNVTFAEYLPNGFSSVPVEQIV